MIGNHLTILRERSISAQALKSATLIATILCTASCAFDTSVPNTPGDVPDAAGENVIDANPAAPDADVTDQKHLLLSEVKTTGAGKEFIEIYNPGASTVDLSDYYLADTQQYMLLPGTFGEGPGSEVATSDFIARFPDGAEIESEQTLVMAVRPTSFNLQFGVDPDFRIGGEPTGEAMREAHADSISPLAALTDSGEGIALFYWNGKSDLVQDVDLIDVGPNTTMPNRLANKSGEQVDGPDPDTDADAYQTDLATMTTLGDALEFGESFHRLTSEDGHEVQSMSGNGLHGHDESSEDIASSWGIEEASPGVAAAGL